MRSHPTRLEQQVARLVQLQDSLLENELTRLVVEDGQSAGAAAARVDVDGALGLLAQAGCSRQPARPVPARPLLVDPVVRATPVPICRHVWLFANLEMSCRVSRLEVVTNHLVATCHLGDLLRVVADTSLGVTDHPTHELVRYFRR